jgi:16S rRNA (cytidine1402-2'-O)-methyltransferase
MMKRKEQSGETQNSMPAGTLHVVATPIGNLEDITLRAVRILSEVDLVAAEDTRRTRVLLDRHGIETRLVALHEHNEDQLAPRLVKRLVKGESLALVSDAGTPLLSDPGYRLVRLAGDEGINIRTVPGASAVTAALSVSGVATDRFAFEGFLPQRRSARLSRLESLRREQRTLLVFESSHRIVECLSDMENVLGGDREAAFCRELTKTFETVRRDSLAGLSRFVREDPQQRKGEIVVVISGAVVDEDERMENAMEMSRALLEFLSVSQAARVASRLCNVSRRELYAALKGKD